MLEVPSLRARFATLYGHTPSLYRAPGRVNLIGEHTDYNDGLAMPAALQFATTLAIGPRAGSTLRVHSLAFDDSVEILLHDRALLGASRPRGHWSDYVTGVVIALWQHGVSVGGADLLIASDIPLGSGLSSSASFEVCVALALSEISNHPLDKLVLATLCRQAENDYVGTRCGIMDQFASTFGRVNHAMALDCRSLEHRQVPLSQRTGAAAPPPPALLVCNTMVRHSHAGGEYNRRRSECEQAVQHLARSMPGLASLRDVAPDDLDAHRRTMDPVIWRRARHVVSENARVTRATQALESGDPAAFGEWMRESHRSLRDDYEVSCSELDLMVSIADGIEGVYGSRMTGGGFGGCTVNWVLADAVDEFTTRMTARYATATGRIPEIYVCATADGATRMGA